MATPEYSKEQVYGIIDQAAKSHGIASDDFMRFASIETGGTFNPHASHSAHGAKGLFQFMPSTASQYGIRGQELDPVANANAAAKMYKDNEKVLVKSHEHDHRPYLSGKPTPDGADMYIAHQQGAGGYHSIQAAIATGHFSRDDTRSNIMNNVGGDLKKLTGKTRDELSHMSDRDLATTFTKYWETKFEHTPVPHQQHAQGTNAPEAPAAAPKQPVAAVAAGTGKISLDSAYADTQSHTHVKYHMGSKDPEHGSVDCSGWVGRMQNETMREINQKAGHEVFSRKDIFNLGNYDAADIVKESAKRSGVLIEGKAVTKGVLKEGMVIGEDNGPKGWDAGRYKGIDHITMVVRDPKNGELMISQSSSGKGVHLTPLDDYLKYKQEHHVHLYATDPLSKARDLLQDKQHTQGPEKDTAKPAAARMDDKSNPDYALYKQALDGVHKLDAAIGRTPDQHSANLAAALVVQAKAEGMTHIDNVAMSADGSKTFAAQNGTAIKQVAGVNTLEGLNTPVEKSTSTLQANQAAQSQNQTQGQNRTQEAPQLRTA